MSFLSAPGATRLKGAKVYTGGPCFFELLGPPARALTKAFTVRFNLLVDATLPLSGPHVVSAPAQPPSLPLEFEARWKEWRRRSAAHDKVAQRRIRAALLSAVFIGGLVAGLLSMGRIW